MDNLFYFIILKFLLILKFNGKVYNQYILQNYNRRILNLCRAIEKDLFRYRRSQLDVTFLSNCLEKNVIPKFLNFKLSSHHLQNSTLRRTTQREFIFYEINRHKRRSNFFKRKSEEKIQILKQSVTFLDYIWISSNWNTFINKKLNFIRCKHQNKLSILLRQHEHFEFLCPDEVITNLSSYSLSSTEKKLLSKGLNFALAPRKIKFCDMALPLEHAARQLLNFKNEHPNECLQADCGLSWRGITTRLKDISLNSFSFFRPPTPNLTNDEYVALRNLQKREDLIIIRPDKGNGVVILDKVDYKRKLQSIINDESKFKKIACNDLFKYISSYEDKFKTKLKKINAEIYNLTCPIGSQPGRLYGLPKIHKPDTPLRPILSSIGTINYSLAKYLVPHLKPATESELSIKDIFSFCKEIPNLSHLKNGVMASFDVESLFTNVPLEETIEILCNYFFPTSEEKFLNLNRQKFKELLRLATMENYFSFNNELYRQMDGVSMGNPLGPTFANAFLVSSEKVWLDTCPEDFKPLLYRRYLDDTFIIFKRHEDIKLFLDYLNSKHNNIKFTCDMEDNQCLPFLGIKITRSDNGFSTSVYRKPTFTGLYTHIDSFVPNLYKFGLIKILLYRTYMLCSTYFALHNEIENIKRILCRNGFPLGLINNFINKFLEGKLNCAIPNNSRPTTKFQLYIKFPFTGPHSIHIRRSIRKLLKKSFPTIEPIFAFTTLERIGSRFRIKDKFPDDIASRIIYLYKCSSCNATYVGKTRRHFLIRRCEHLGITPRLRKRSKTIPNSAIFEHGLKEDHLLKEEDFKILDRAQNSGDLSIKEALHIYQMEPTLNSQLESSSLVILQR